MKFVCPLFCLLLAVGCRSRQQPQPISIVTTPDYDKGFSFLNRENDSAYYYFNKVVNRSKDSLQIAMAYNNMAICQSDAGDYYGSQESLLTSLRYLREENAKDGWCLVADNNELGTDNLNLKQYDAAITYYGRAAALAKDDVSKAIALNNTALAYEKKGLYARAISIYESVVEDSKKRKKEYPRVLTNLAIARWREDSDYQAAPDLLVALQIRKSEQDDWGLNSSYSHLADYYAVSRPDSALGYARERYTISRRIGSPDDEVEALRKLILLGPAKEAKGYFSRYQHLQDSLETARNNAKNQFALIRYEVEKNKADNLRLRSENADRTTEIVRQRAVTAGVILVLVLLVGWAVGWYRKRKQRMEWEKERARQEERFRLSQKVHDVVANGIYRVAKEAEQLKNGENQQVVDQLWDLYDTSRDISYQPATTSEDDFQVRINELLSVYATADRKVLIAGNEERLWKDVKPGVKTHLGPILQELMVNMDKHSGARNVVILFEEQGLGLIIQYTDDGVGLAADHEMGKGFTSTGNRITSMGGRIIFDRNSPTGVRIRIHIPKE